MEEDRLSTDTSDMRDINVVNSSVEPELNETIGDQLNTIYQLYTGGDDPEDVQSKFNTLSEVFLV